MDEDSRVELPSVSCGCGFRVVGIDETNNESTFFSHACPDAPSRPWQAYVFSFWGAAEAAIVAAAVVILTMVEGGVPPC